MNEYLRANRENWNEKTPIHARSDFYDVEGFKSGKSTLMPIEIEELGDVSGKSMLHLQCHFGLDTLSWARLGARVTGVDFSDKAIELARSLSKELGLAATFVESNIYDLPDVLNGQYDIVFTSYGVLCWLPDLRRWAQVVSHFLKPGGTFYMVEMHPFASVFDDENADDFRLRYPYFPSQEPLRFEPGWTYTDASAPLTTYSYEWSHSLGEILDSLISVGLRMGFLHEFPYTVYKALSMAERGQDGWWRLPKHRDSIPLLFSLKATKDQEKI